MRLSPLNLIFLLFCLPLAQPAHAAAPRDPVRAIRFFYAGFSQSIEDDDPNAVFFLRDGRDAQEFTLHANAFSQTIDYSGPLPAPVLLKQQTEDGPKLVEVGRLACPAEWKGVLFIVTRDPADTAFPFRFHPVEYWAPSVPDRHLRLINFCVHPLAAKVDSTQVMIAAQSTRDISLAGTRLDIPLKLVIQGAERWERLLSTAIARPPQNKLLMLAIPSPAGKARIILADNLPEPPPAPDKP